MTGRVTGRLRRGVRVWARRWRQRAGVLALLLVVAGLARPSGSRPAEAWRIEEGWPEGAATARAIVAGLHQLRDAVAARWTPRVPVGGGVHRLVISSVVGSVLVLGAGLLFRRWFGAVARARRRLAAMTIARMQLLSPRGFEEFVADLLRARGWADVTVMGGAGDLGVDVQGRAPGGRLGIAQCKRYAPDRRVTSSEVQLFLGRCVLYAPGGAWVYATTSTLTGPAAALARAYGVEVLCAERLAALLRNATPDPLGALMGEGARGIGAEDGSRDGGARDARTRRGAGTW